MALLVGCDFDRSALGSVMSFFTFEESQLIRPCGTINTGMIVSTKEVDIPGQELSNHMAKNGDEKDVNRYGKASTRSHHIIKSWRSPRFRSLDSTAQSVQDLSV